MRTRRLHPFLALLLAWGGGGGVVSAAPWIIVADSFDGTIHTVDLGTTPPTVYGPFAPAPFVISGGLGGVGVVPGERHALVKNSAGPLYLIDISNPKAPIPIRTINVRQIGSDLTIASNGRFAIPTQEIVFVVVDLVSFVVTGRSLALSAFRPNCVTLSPDNSTVIFCDLLNDRLVYGSLNSTFTDLVSETTIFDHEPRNAIVGRDGQTLLVGNADDSVNVFRISAPGTLVPGTPPILNGLPGAQESFALDPNSSLVYVLSTRPSPDQISILEITGPGDVQEQSIAAVTSRSDADGTAGINTLGITPAGDRLVVGSVVAPELTIVDLPSFAVSSITTNGTFPTGLAVFQGPALPSEPIPVLSGRFLLLLFFGTAAAGLILLRR
jgi:hypothetical protein